LKGEKEENTNNYETIARMEQYEALMIALHVPDHLANRNIKHRNYHEQAQRIPL